MVSFWSCWEPAPAKSFTVGWGVVESSDSRLQSRGYSSRGRSRSCWVTSLRMNRFHPPKQEWKSPGSLLCVCALDIGKQLGRQIKTRLDARDTSTSPRAATCLSIPPFHSFTLLCPSLRTKTHATTIQKRKRKNERPLTNVSLYRTPFILFYFIFLFSFRFVLGWLNCRATRIGTEENEKYTTVLLANIFIHQSQKEHGEEKR